MARRPALTSVETLALRKELRRRQRAVPRLMKKREKLLGQVAQIDAVLAALGAVGGRVAAPGGARKRHKNDSNLVEALHKLLDGSAMTVTEAAAAVQKAGYRTTSSTFRTIVNQTLINSGKFKRMSRGVYTSK